MTDKSSRGPSQRQLRAGELIRHALAGILMRADVADPELETLAISVHEVQMSPDLKIATAFISSLIHGKDDAALAALNRNKKFLRGLVAPRIEMKYMPEIRYRIDTSLDYANKIDAILKSPDVARDLRDDGEGPDHD